MHSNRNRSKLRSKTAYLKLDNLQKWAIKLISGGQRRTTGHLFNAEPYLLPIKYIIGITTARVRDIVTVQTAGIHPTGTQSRKKKRNLVPLQVFYHHSAPRKKTLETTVPFLHAPWEAFPMGQILSDELHALINHARLISGKSCSVFFQGL